jgi:hypothetical protein
LVQFILQELIYSTQENRLESVLDVGDSGFALAEAYPDHVEAHVVEVRLLLGDVTFRHSADRGLLAGGDRLEGITEARPPAQLHLDEYEAASLP